MRSLLLSSLLLCSLPAAAQVYTYLDSEGNRVFTDAPRSSNSERVELAPSNSMPILVPPAAPAPSAEPVQPQLRYSLLRILVPQPDASIRDGAGELIVSVNSEPPLLPQHRYRLLLDGQAVGEPGSSPVFPLQNIDRGTHQLAVEIIDEQGRIIERTPSQPFHMLRISLAQKRKVRPCVMQDFGVRPECPLKDKPEPRSDIPFVPFL